MFASLCSEAIIIYSVLLKVPMKRKCLFDIFVDKGLKFMFLLLKLNIAPFNNSKISVKYDKSYATNSMRSEICTVACDVNTFGKSLWSAGIASIHDLVQPELRGY